MNADEEGLRICLITYQTKPKTVRIVYTYDPLLRGEQVKEWNTGT